MATKSTDGPPLKHRETFPGNGSYCSRNSESMQRIFGCPQTRFIFTLASLHANCTTVGCMCLTEGGTPPFVLQVTKAGCGGLELTVDSYRTSKCLGTESSLKSLLVTLGLKLPV